MAIKNNLVNKYKNTISSKTNKSGTSEMMKLNDGSSGTPGTTTTPDNTSTTNTNASSGSNILSNVGNYLSNAVTNASNAVNEASASAEAAKQAQQEKRDAFVNGSGENSISSALSNAYNNAKNYVTNAASNIGSKAKDVLSGYADSVANNLNASNPIQETNTDTGTDSYNWQDYQSLINAKTKNSKAELQSALQRANAASSNYLKALGLNGSGAGMSQLTDVASQYQNALANVNQNAQSSVNSELMSQYGDILESGDTEEAAAFRQQYGDQLNEAALKAQEDAYNTSKNATNLSNAATIMDESLSSGTYEDAEAAYEDLKTAYENSTTATDANGNKVLSDEDQRTLNYYKRKLDNMKTTTDEEAEAKLTSNITNYTTGIDDEISTEGLSDRAVNALKSIKYDLSKVESDTDLENLEKENYDLLNNESYRKNYDMIYTYALNKNGQVKNELSSKSQKLLNNLVKQGQIKDGETFDDGKNYYLYLGGSYYQLDKDKISSWWSRNLTSGEGHQYWK